MTVEKFPIAGRFVIARGAKTEAAVVTVTLTEGERRGHGECVPYGRYGETLESVVAAIEAQRPALERGVDRQTLQSLMPAGAARNAVDCALWDFEAKTSGIPAYKTAGLTAMSSAITAYTISLGTAPEMAESARKASHRALLKVKLGAPGGDFERIAAVREAAPNASLIADANEGWTTDNLVDHLRACKVAGFSLIEQPLPAKNDHALRDVEHVVPLCADESVHDRASLDRLVGLYDVVNIKLDKTGGLTEALALAEAAEARKFGLMIGCMVGSSLAMAPAMILAARAQFVDLDGPLLLAKDREPGLRFADSLIFPPTPALWG